MPFRFIPRYANASAGLLDGTQWKVEVVTTRQTANKDAQQFEDLLSFSRDHLASRKLKRSGIRPFRYSAKGTPAFYNWETAPAQRIRASYDGVAEKALVRFSPRV